MSDELETHDAPSNDNGQFSEQPEVTTPPQPQAVSLSPDTIKTLVDSLKVAPVVPAQPASQPQLSQEEINRALAVFNADRRYVERMGLKFEDPTQYDEAVAALNEMLDGKTRQAVTMSTLVVENLKRQLMGELEPLKAYVAQAREQQLRDEFFKEHDDLRQFEPLVEAVYMKMQRAGAHFNTREDAFKAVAEQARQLLAKVQPGQGDGGGASATSTPRKMPTVTTGGRGGASASAAGKPIDAVAKSLFGG